MAIETWDIDAVHSTVHFTVGHMVISKVHGRFSKWSGTLEMDAGNSANSSVEVHIDAASIDTGEADRDAHLRSADFLDVERYPEITYTSKRIEPVDASHFRAVGDLEIRGTRRETVLDCTLGGRATDPWGNERIGLEATAKFDRKDFGVAWNQPLDAGGLLVGDEIEVTIALEAVKKTQAIEGAA